MVLKLLWSRKINIKEKGYKMKKIILIVFLFLITQELYPQWASWTHDTASYNFPVKVTISNTFGNHWDALLMCDSSLEVSLDSFATSVKTIPGVPFYTNTMSVGRNGEWWFRKATSSSGTVPWSLRSRVFQ
jgi:hypothetical protein